jgi:hypothetical protein
MLNSLYPIRDLDVNNTREYPIFTSKQTNHRKGTRLSSRPGNLF